MNRNARWLDTWQKMANMDDAFCTMGRSAYTITDYFKYLSNIATGLGQINQSDRLLDMAGGAGYIAMYFSPLVAAVDSFDYASDMIKKSKSICSGFNNITPYVDNLLTLDETKAKGHLYNKAVLGGALQLFEDYAEVKLILQHLFDVMTLGGQAIVTHNTDIALKQAHIESYDLLDWSKEKINEALKAEQDRLWMDFQQVKEIALTVGFKECYKQDIHPELFQSSHMFDFVLVK